MKNKSMNKTPNSLENVLDEAAHTINCINPRVLLQAGEAPSAGQPWAVAGVANCVDPFTNTVST